MKTNRAFTLVELLVVVVIICILATLVTLAIAGAQRSAKKARIAVEMHQIAMALEHYKNEIGEYPPDMFDDDAIVRHVKKRFPRFVIAGADTAAQSQNIRRALTNVYANSAVYPPNLRQQWSGLGAPINCELRRAAIQSLALWLGGFIDTDGKMKGFGSDPEAPFGRDDQNRINNGDISAVTANTVALGTPDKKTFLELEVNKNVAIVPIGSNSPNAQLICLVSKLNSDTFVPIVYFRGRSDGGASAYIGGFYTGSPAPRQNYELDSYNFYYLNQVWQGLGTAVAYATKGRLVFSPATRIDGGEWLEAERYQLIHPGLDGKFGPDIRNDKQSSTDYFRTLENLKPEDRDNITNFSDFKEIQAILK